MSSRLTQPTYTFDKRDPFRFATALNLPHPPTDYFPRQYISKQTKLAVYDRVLHAPLKKIVFRVKHVRHSASAQTHAQSSLRRTSENVQPKEVGDAGGSFCFDNHQLQSTLGI